MPRSHAIATFVVLSLAAAVAYLALRSSPYVQYIPWMPRGIGSWADRNGILRNVVAFWALGLGVFLVLGRGARYVVGLCVFGIALEVSQLGIRGRVFDWKDIGATLVGIFLAWLIACLVRRRTA